VLWSTPLNVAGRGDAFGPERRPLVFDSGRPSREALVRCGELKPDRGKTFDKQRILAAAFLQGGRTADAAVGQGAIRTAFLASSRSSKPGDLFRPTELTPGP